MISEANVVTSNSYIHIQYWNHVQHKKKKKHLRLGSPKTLTCDMLSQLSAGSFHFYLGNHRPRMSTYQSLKKKTISVFSEQYNLGKLKNADSTADI